MQSNEEFSKELMNLSNDVMKLSRNTLVVNLRFMDMAISSLNWIPYSESFAVDGKSIYYNPIYVLQSYKKAKELPVRLYLHSIFHCVFQHSYINTLVNKRLWNLACDIAVESSINDLHLNCVNTSKVNNQINEIQNLKKKCKYITAEVLYRYFLDANIDESKLKLLESLFSIDDHSIWYPKEKQDSLSVLGSTNESNNQSNNDQSSNENESQGNDDLDNQSLKDKWKDISEQMQMDLETFSKQKGNQAGSMMQNLKEVNREKYDYASFLKKFSVMGEAMKINDDEFDYIFYTYGMNLFPEKRMPLIEPLEYKDVKRIKEFVIAIDTSGSVSGELVQKFIQKTYNILMNEESYFQKINIHIIQCDTEIQEDHKITSQREFDEYIKTMKLHGFGGTDFRPVFQYVDELINKKEFTNLKGMIYFTDGFGVFPNRQPNYETAFVFLENEYNNPEVPVWAIKVVLRDGEI